MANHTDSAPDPVTVFMETPLVQWIQFLLNKDTLDVEDLADGVALNQIMLQIDPRPTNMKAHKNARQDINLNIQNLMILIKHIKSYYEEMRKQVIVMSLPKILPIVRNSRSPEGLAEMQKLLLLILGCAVQCDHREQFILKMKQLTYDGMETMMNHIKYITENPDNVINMQWEELTDIPPDEIEDLTRKLSDHIHTLVADRDEITMMNTEVTLERDYLQSQMSGTNLTRRESFTSSASRQHLMLEINELKSKLRKTKHELDEKVEQNVDLKQECEDFEALLQDIRKENSELITDARSARALRDENDILKEKAGKASRLEFELEMLKEKLKDVEFYKQRVEEVREDNRVLHETKDLLEEQLESTRDRLDGLVDAEKKIIDLKRQLHDFTEERERDRQHIQELLEKNSNLEMDKLQSMSESGNLAYQLEQARGTFEGRSTIQAELEESANTKALRLEKENKHLQALINTYKDSVKSSELTQANMVELEKENQRLSNKVQQLQQHINKEKQSVLDFEQLSNELAVERQRLETTLETSRATSERRIQEMEEESSQLNKTINSLRERAKIGGDAKVKAIEKENKVLSELVKDMTSKLHKSEYDRKQLGQKLTDVKESVDQAEVIQKENSKLEKQNVSLEKTVKQLQIQCNNVEELEHKTSDLEIENRQLKKQVETLKQLTEQLQEIEQDKNISEQEATRLRRQVESLKKSCSRMSELEQDKLDTEKRATRLQQSLDTMKASLKHVEKMEVVQVELESELDRVRGQLEVNKQRLNKRENEIYELEKENEQVNSKLNQLVISNKKLERFDSENRELESDNNKLETNNKKLNGEVQRLKRLLETKTTQFEDTNDELSVAVRQNKFLNTEVEELRKASTQSTHTEVNYKKLQKQQGIEKRTLNALREELVNEKLTTQQKQAELDRLHAELADIGINKEELLKGSDNDERFKALESRLESTVQKSLGAKDDKINSLESRLKESVNLNNKLRVDIKNLKREYEALSQRHQEEVLSEHQSSPKKDVTTAEIFKMKDHLISVERKNATLLADNAALKSSSHDLQSHVKSLQSQVENLQRQHNKVQESSDNLQKQCARLQVENSTLQSQCTSLMSQNAQSNTTQSSIEAEKINLIRRLSEFGLERSQLEKDHDDMTILYERQTVELESLMQDHQKLKQNYRQVRQENKELEEKYSGLLKRNNEVNKQRKSETYYASENLEVLKEAHDKLHTSYQKLNRDYESLDLDHITLKSNLNLIKVEYAKLEAETSDIRDHNQQLDIATTKLNNRCEVLLQLKANLEEENKHLLEQISRLMSQNEELLSQTLESKDQIYSEQKQYTERMQEIRRQKEKLEEKIMDIYRTPGPSPSKRKGFGATIKKTFQNLGKTSESRRRRDGLPPYSSASSLMNPSETPPTSIKRSDSASDDHAGKIDTGSIDSASDVTDSSRKNSVETKENKRRNKLGGPMAYSTNAINTLSVISPTSSDVRSNVGAPAPKGPQPQSRTASSVGHPRKALGSTGDVSYPGERHNDSDYSQNDSQDPSPTKEKISLQQFLVESDKKKDQGPSTNVNGQEKPAAEIKPVPAKRSSSPGKRQPMRATSWATSSYRRSKASWLEEDKGQEKLASKMKRAPPSLDLTSLEDSKSIQETDSGSAGPSPGKSPKSASTLALIKIAEKESEGLLTDEERDNLRRETFVYVVRSKSDAASHYKGDKASGSLGSPDERRGRANVVMRSRHSPQPRPSSMHLAPTSKPTSSVAPISAPHLTLSRPNSASPMSAVQRLDSLVGSPRGSSKDVTKSSPRSINGDEPANLRPKSSAGLPNQHRPVSTFSTPTYSAHLPRYGHRVGTPTDGIGRSREMTSTPVSSRSDLAGPMGTTMIRKDVPPPSESITSAPSPIRRDVPPDASAYSSLPRRPRALTTPDKSSSSVADESSSFHRRPPTPKETSTEESDKSTLWYEYGCV
ncbi:girdin-like isoform X2 [Clavelina lepadiformis]|uniref:girdin-like isoform X2 n=1 Tax=Clavelina lepadiformis TaxID=159417 RepID=UPI004042DAA5